MKEKKLLIVENCGSNLKFEQDSDSIILTGLFTTFCQKNRNGRIYESTDFLPHVEALKEQMEAGALLGELDHPHSFETTLSNVSHVIENLEYDAQQNAIVGRVRLLNTSKGKEAQALIKDGIPLHISSRAAGTVDESGKVRLQQLFTYDLVAEPGFANARLKRVNESYGFSDDGDVAIFDLTEGMNTELTPEIGKEGGQLTANDGVEQIEKNKIENTNNSTNNMDNGQYISYSDFQRYSEHLSDIITDLQSAIANYKTELTSIKGRPTMEFDPENVDNSMIADLIAKEVESQVKKVSRVPQNSGVVCVKCGDENCDGSCDGKVSDLERKAQAMEEKYSNLVKYVSYIAENLDKSITHQDYIVEETNNIIKHNNYLAEHMNNVIKHNDYLAENMNNVIEHNNYIVENLNDTIGYQEYVAEMLDKSIDYSNMLAEEHNKTIAYNDYLAEKMNQMVKHQDYLAENLEKSIEHNDYIVENINNITRNNRLVEESYEEIEDINNVVNESVRTPKTKREIFDSKKYQNEISEKLSALISNVKSQYEETKRLEAEALEESRKNADESKNFNLINYMPARLNDKWSKLSDERKKEILAESKMFVITTPQNAEYFWNTRDMREKQVNIQKIEESVTANKVSTGTNETVMQDDRYKMMSEEIKMRMRRF